MKPTHKEVDELIALAEAKANEAKTMLEGDRTEKKGEKMQALMAESKAALQQAAQLREILEQDESIQAEKKAQAVVKSRADKAVAPGATMDMRGTPTPDGKPFETFGEFLYAVYAVEKGWGPPDPRIQAFAGDGDDGRMEKKDLSDTSLATGGAVVPTEFYNRLMAVAAERAIVRPRATVIRMARRTMPIPVLDQTTVPSGGSSAFYGGIIVKWLESEAPKPETEPKFRQIQLVARELSGYCEVGNTLMDDAAISFQDLLGSQIGFVGAVTHAEDFAFLRGNGAGMPIGVKDAPATYGQARVTAGNIEYADVVNMFAHSLMGGNYVWIAHQSAIPQIFTLKDDAGNTIWLPNFSVATAGPGALLGYPIYWTEKLPSVGNDGDIMFCDFNYYLIGDRQLVTIDTSEHYLFRNNQTAWRVITRVTGQPWLSSPITLADGTWQVSPFVKLTDYAGT